MNIWADYVIQARPMSRHILVRITAI